MIDTTQPEYKFLAALLSRRRVHAALLAGGLVISACGILVVLVGFPTAGRLLIVAGIATCVFTTYASTREPVRLSRRVARYASRSGIISAATGGFVITRNGEPLFTSWNSVVAVQVFKRDLLTTDCICTVFTLSDGRGIEIHEELLGWQALMCSLPEYLPGTPQFEEWWSEVAFPAFETKLTSLFSRTPAA